MDEVVERIKNMCEFTGRVYSVGDGFCYEGNLKNKSDNRYHFVIDCGSKPPTCKGTSILSSKRACHKRLQKITDKIAENNKHIDVFILTHLHEDHYNGYEYLFNKTNIDTVIMPYLYLEERLCLMLTKSDLSDEDIEFLADPYRKILSLLRIDNPDAKLILFRGTEDEDSTNQDDISSFDNIQWGVWHENAKEIFESEDITDSEKPYVQIVRAFPKKIRIPNFSLEWKFFNLKIDITRIDELRKIVGKLTPKRLRDIITNDNDSKKLKDKYSEIASSLSNNINDTSIVIYCGFIGKHERLGTLITGDINLRKGITEKILNYFDEEIEKVRYFSIPHHGSKKNWSYSFIKTEKLDHSDCFASTHKNYKCRLTKNMKSKLKQHNIRVHVVDENRDNDYEYCINSCDNSLIMKKGRGREFVGGMGCQKDCIYDS